MQNRIDHLFHTKKNILSVYFTAGYPQLNDTIEIIKTLEKSGVDMIEIGMPFSDPMADGPVIQQSSQKALENGMSLQLLFHQLENIRKEVSIPLLLMGYLNPVYQYGIPEFCAMCSKVGIDGLILPDLPMIEYLKHQKLFENYGLYNIFLVTPQTTDDRIREIDQVSKGFIYLVSSFSTTGSGKGIEDSRTYFEKIQKMNLKNPGVIGFGISNPASFEFACKYAQGGIIGSAFVKMIANEGLLKDKIENFVKPYRNGFKL